MIIKSIEPIRPKFKQKALKLICSPFQKKRGLFVRVDEFMAAFEFGCITDNEARLYWYSNIFNNTPETQKPRDIAINAACESVVKCTPTLALAGAMVANQ